MNRRRLLALSGGMLAAALAGCVGGDDDGVAGPRTPASDDGTDEPSSPALSDDELDALVAATNGFAFDLYDELVTDSPEDNLFSSPVSIAIALAMAYAGAGGKTREQMREVLRYELDDDLVHAGFGELQAALDERSQSVDSEDSEDDQPFELSVVNSAWGQEGYPFKDAYLTTLTEHYSDGLWEVDFEVDPEDARETINDWVADETEDRIDELLPEGSLDELTRFVLVNAVYFLANWKHTFTEDLTSSETFAALDGEEYEVQMMQQERTWSYAEVDGAQVVDLPYVGEDVSMLVVLPPEGAFEEYEESFDEGTLEAIVGALESQEGTVYLPRFEFEGSFKLREPLRALGMTDAFDSGAANFEGISESGEQLYLYEAYHDTFVAVDEAGTEASAATAVVGGDASAPQNPFEFVADRPFLFAIRDRPTGSLLFFGRAVDPAGWE